jgi:penicillin-binding protein 1A
LVAAYGVFANGGHYVEPYAIERIEEADGTVLHRHEPKPVASIRPEVAYIITHLLKGVVERGTGRGAAVLGRPIAGKTGTTNDFRDNWFI